ncbi:hypothetical protein RGF97_21520 [Streptomyces roseicoloratus]|uniref:Uncharacterized protein n=1 Tax=Streptomyces roseicoloratus TaxID=2508722 RepID=A0ABY9RXH4_9ACTN|nr:hypothetical protein [Streptomyces roseicoloratus]WMX46881.1 hypothetical protein RGF97_21520 [Streptomyces roseicoloratus]
MRPQRFTDFVLDLAKNAPGATRVQTFADAGDTKHPFGLVITASGRETRWQFLGQLPEGAKHEGFADDPVTGAPAPSMGDPAAADSPEAWLTAVVAGAECPEIQAIERWSTRETSNSAPGFTVTFHNQARIFARQF